MVPTCVFGSIWRHECEFKTIEEMFGWHLISIDLKSPSQKLESLVGYAYTLLQTNEKKSLTKYILNNLLLKYKIT
jgi:hypothetical protein